MDAEKVDKLVRERGDRRRISILVPSGVYKDLDRIRKLMGIKYGTTVSLTDILGPLVEEFVEDLNRLYPKSVSNNFEVSDDTTGEDSV